MLKNAFVLVSGLALLAGCKSTQGNLTIVHPLKVNATVTQNWGDDSGSTEIREQTIDTGKYDMEVQVKSDRELLLRVKANGTTDLYVNVPEGVKIPTTTGDFEIPAAKSGQPFDLQGKVVVLQSESPVQRGTEICTVRRDQTVCSTGPNGHTQCWIQTVTYTGQRQVEFTVFTTERSLLLSFLAAGTADAQANYSGSRKESERRYSYAGICY